VPPPPPSPPAPPELVPGAAIPTSPATRPITPASNYLLLPRRRRRRRCPGGIAGCAPARRVGGFDEEQLPRRESKDPAVAKRGGQKKNSTSDAATLC